MRARLAQGAQRSGFVEHQQYLRRNMTGLMGYVSWGSNDRYYDPAAYKSLRFANGGIVETAVSTGARTFLQPYDGGQSWWRHHPSGRDGHERLRQ